MESFTSICAHGYIQCFPSIYFFIYAFIYLYLSIHSLSISTFFIIYLLRFVLILHAHRSCQISPILGPQVSHGPQPGRSGSPASQSSARRERNGKAIAALGACGACRRPLQRADPRPPRLGDVARDGQVRWWKSTKGRKVKMKMKAGKKMPFLLDFAIFGWPFHFRHERVSKHFQTIARTQQGHVPGHLGDTELSRKENLGSAGGMGTQTWSVSETWMQLLHD